MYSYYGVIKIGCSAHCALQLNSTFMRLPCVSKNDRDYTIIFMMNRKCNTFACFAQFMCVSYLHFGDLYKQNEEWIQWNGLKMTENVLWPFCFCFFFLQFSAFVIVVNVIGCMTSYFINWKKIEPNSCFFSPALGNIFHWIVWIGYFQ